MNKKIFIITSLLLAAVVFARGPKQGRNESEADEALGQQRGRANSERGEGMGRQRGRRGERKRPAPMFLIEACRGRQLGDSCIATPPKNPDTSRPTPPSFKSTCLSIPEKLKSNPEILEQLKASDKYFCKPLNQPPRPEDA
ncbi:MAG: hypothetical protein KA116_03430 [Proteobacteria bacterium]|nr:hypothetical protein [Pseudomonadota bacterium]